MKRLLLQLTVSNLLLLAVVIVWGHFIARDSSWSRQFDLLVGMAGLFSLTVHSIIYTYFIVSGKFVQSAIEEHGYRDATARQRARSYKLKAFRYGFIAIVFTSVAMMLHFWSGASAGEGAIWRGWAAISAWLALLVSLYAAKIEWKYIGASSVLSEEILDALGDRTHTAPAAPAGSR
ncbi:MAG: hypothetical protein IT430_14100 [Phycisphaerales bacterium]|nr:hypothetical protein [Phycisphaerales bacterium]